MTVTLSDIEKAANRIEPYIDHTPIMTSSTLNKITHADLFFKCEIFQKMGAFKFRGASNAVFALTDEEAKHGVTTHSSGNHGAALALAARNRGIPAYIVMPNNSTQVKIDAVRGYGGQITFSEPGMPAREATLEKVIAETGAIPIHPYNHERVIAGQGTVALELLEQVKNLDMIVVPVGGGGLIAGISTAISALAPQIKVIGAEPEMANDAFLSFKAKQFLPAGSSQTICDGLAASLGPTPFPIILKNVSDIYTASEKSILAAVRYLWERMKIIVEPSGAIGLAVILQYPEIFKDKKIGIVLSGGNADIKKIAGLM